MIVRLTGGLGNQLFGYGFGRSLSIYKKEPVQFHWHPSSWPYALEPFKLPIELVNPETVPLVYHEATFGWDGNVYNKPLDTYYVGYWQTAKYFVPALRDDFKHWLNFPLSARLPEGYVSIHVRRGDYLNSGTKEFHGTLSEDYYQAAIDYVKSRVLNPTFVVYTDDPNMKEFMGYPIGSTSNQHLDLWALTGFSHSILANSTFSWFGAWLGEKPGQIVVAPKQWFANPLTDTSDLIPSRWMRI